MVIKYFATTSWLCPASPLLNNIFWFNPSRTRLREQGGLVGFSNLDPCRNARGRAFLWTESRRCLEWGSWDRYWWSWIVSPSSCALHCGGSRQSAVEECGSVQFWGVPLDVVSDRDSRFLGRFWTVKRGRGQNSISPQAFTPPTRPKELMLQP